MTIKEIPHAAAGASIDGQARKQKPISSLARVSVRTPAESPVVVAAAGHSKSPAAADLRARANQVISLTNLVAEATGEIEKMIQSIGGIAEQASGPHVSERQRAILEREANELVDEIRRRAMTTGSGGVHPLAGDKIRLEIEEKFGKALEVIFPEDAKDGFGLGQIRFSAKDQILQTLATVGEAQERIARLRDAVSHGIEAVKDVVGTLEVAIRNTESSSASVRDLDQAAKLAEKTSLGIAENPETAIDSAGDLNKTSLQLLE